MSTDPDTTRCKHCGKRIVQFNGYAGPAWTHQPAGASFMDHSHYECHTPVATPPEANDAAEGVNL